MPNAKYSKYYKIVSLSLKSVEYRSYLFSIYCLEFGYCVRMRARSTRPDELNWIYRVLKYCIQHINRQTKQWKPTPNKGRKKRETELMQQQYTKGTRNEREIERQKESNQKGWELKWRRQIEVMNGCVYVMRSFNYHLIRILDILFKITDWKPDLVHLT